MTERETPAGTPVIDLSPEEYDAYLESEVERLAGMTVSQFTDAYVAGTVDDADPSVGELAGLLRIGQNGHRISA